MIEKNYLKITVQFRNGQKRTIKTTLQPSITDGCVFIKNMGENSGGSFFPLDNIQSVDIIPEGNFDLDSIQRDISRQDAITELESLRKK